MNERGALFVGTSGFAYKEWKGVFYPEGTPDRQMLSHYSKVLSSVEINYTFRRMPSEKTIEGWKTQSTDDFRFTLKAPQRITHIKRLNDVSEDVNEFMRLSKLLGERLGTVLFQLPPSMKFERSKLEKFLGLLPPMCRYAMEFRHESWSSSEVTELLSANEVAYCGADTQDKALSEVPLTASGYAFLRLRKQDYPTEEISGWAKRVDEVLAGGRDVYCYFKHEGGGVGPAYALSLREQVP